MGGTFLWKQMRMAIDSGANMIYVAMFDEVDEGTAIYKVAEDSQHVPIRTNFVKLNSDQNFGYRCVPSDWYMSLVGNATQYLREGRALPLNIPPLPTNCPFDTQTYWILHSIK